MKQLLLLAIAIACCYTMQAQTVDLSKAPGQANTDLTTKKSNAQLLQEAKSDPATPQSDAALSEKYKADVQAPNGTSRVFVPATTTPGVQNQGGMMNSTSTQQSIGNLNTTSTVIYDDAGKVKSNSTSIKLGK